MKRALIVIAVALFLVGTAAAGEIGFIEDFALSKNRAAALQQLIPGTEDYYYYHCLHYLNTEQYDKAAAMTRPWLDRFGQTARLTEIQTRHALLTYDRNPQRTLDYLKQRLGLRFDQQQADLGAAPNLPSVLDARLIARETLRQMSFARWSLLENFDDEALNWLATESLNAERRRNLLQRLRRPDVPNLPRLVADDLASANAADFGAYPIHGQMTQTQLEELVRLRPGLLNHAAYVQIMIRKLAPNADEDWRHDPKLTRAYLDRLLTFVRRLEPVHNALKAHALYHRLVLDRTQDTYDKALFLEYVKLPRQQPYMAKALLEAIESQRHPADLSATFDGLTLLPAVGHDEPLVRSYLKRLFLTADSPKEYEPFINDIYLKRLFAETKIENGLGEQEQWAAQLPPETFRDLKDRIDLDFAPTNKTSFAADEAVRLDLFVKNVPTLLVKVFEINTTNWYRTQEREVDTDINLDGLTANAQETHSYTEPPLRRIQRRFEFPQLSKPGVYVIDFIGSGKSSRALIRKGRLRPLVSASTAGMKLTIVDDANRLVKDAALWLGGQEFKAGEDGTIMLPFSTQPGRQPIVLSRGDFACLDHLDHRGEEYSLRAGIYVDREQLLSQRVAKVLVRPGLYLNGKPVSLRLLEEVKLRITATDLDGIDTATDVPDFKVFEDRESIHEFRVPSRLASLEIRLQAKVKSLSQNTKVDVASSGHFQLNGIDRTDKTENLHLAQFGPEYAIELLGRTGEVKPDRPVQLELWHRDFKEPVRVTLKTDAQGRIRLGPLADIRHLKATGPEGTSQNWQPDRDEHSYRDTIHAKAGTVVTLPYLGTAAMPARDELALFAMRGDVIQADRFDALAIQDGFLELRGLAAGDYELVLKRQGKTIGIRIVDGPVAGGYVLGSLRQLQLPMLKPVQIGSITPAQDSITIRLRDASPSSRVHVFATRYRPEYSAFNLLSEVRDAGLDGVLPAHAESAYITGRNLGDEYRYILDRKSQKKFPGNPLDRPALLLNPWAKRSTETGEQMPMSGEDYRKRGEPPPSRKFGGAGEGSGPGKQSKRETTPDLDFLADASAVLVNLAPDKEGVVRINRKDLGPHAMIHVLAVDVLNTTYRSITLPEQPAQFLDLRLSAGLDPKGHFTQQKQVTLLAANQKFTMNTAGNRFEAYDSLAKVHALYSTLSKDAKLAQFAQFAFILNWPNLKPEEKRALYSKHACHELSFFIAKKDPAFFRTVVRPYLANKKDKTFLDHWLLEDDLSAYAQPWQFQRLNTVERILLAQRLADEPARTTRHLGDLLRLVPPNPDRQRTLFETALRGSVLQPRESTFVASVNGEKELILKEPDKEKDPVGWQNWNQRMQRNQPAREPMPAPATPPVPVSPEGIQAPAKPGLEGKGADAPAEHKAKNGKAHLKDQKEELQELKKELERTKELMVLDDARTGAALLRGLYTRLDPTREWAEDNYYHLPIQQQLAALVPVSGFWLDYARHDGRGPFLSKDVAQGSRNFTEMMFALSVLDLPFEAGKHEVKVDTGKLTFTPAGPVIAFHEEFRSVGAPPANSQVIVSQNFYRQGDRFKDEDGERSDKFVTAEFVVQTVYGCQVVVTNLSSSRQRLSVLLQMPVGSIPLANGQFTKSVLLDLEPYRTQTIDYLFYFPKPGRFAHFPVHVARNEVVVAAAAPFEFNVVARPSKLDTESWQYVSQQGAAEQVLAFLNRENVSALDLNRIAFRMRDKAFFEAVIQLLQDRHAYQPTLWSFALYHNAVPAARQYLLHVDQIVNECGGPLNSPLLTVDPVARHQYEHLEYKPLVNARAHPLGQKRQIVNARLLEQYQRFLKLLSYQQQLNDEELLAVTYYLLLQDRIDEALATFAQVNAGKVATKVQYDYCAAHLDLFSDDPLKARAIAAPYADYPVDRWRNAFAAIINYLHEVEGQGPKVIDPEDRTQRQGQLAAKEPSFEFTLDGKTINLVWQNLDAVRVNFYLMDVEVLFSRSPFVQSGLAQGVAQVAQQFASIRPNATKEVKLPAGQSKLAIPLPEELARRNVLVEIVAGGKTRSQPYYANAMNVQLAENYGQLEVRDAANGKAVAKVYVKSYVRLADGQVKFWKDGYTDLRGRFDYVSVSTPERVPPERFSILVLSEFHGAQIREVSPPQQ